MLEDKPYLVELATSMASCKLLISMMQVIGPKISSCAIRIFGLTFVKRVGEKKNPFLRGIFPPMAR